MYFLYRGCISRLIVSTVMVFCILAEMTMPWMVVAGLRPFFPAPGAAPPVDANRPLGGTEGGRRIADLPVDANRPLGGTEGG